MRFPTMWHFDKYRLTVILLPAHPASFAHKFLFQRVLASPGMQRYCRLVIKISVLDKFAVGTH